jgi:hypothetical protein
MSIKGKIGIFLSLLSLAGAGAIMVFPQHTEIGGGLIVISIIGFILLALHHYGLRFRGISPVFWTLILGIVFIGFPAGFITQSFIERMAINHDRNAIPQPMLSATMPKNASECKPQDSLDITPSYLVDLYKNRTTIQGDELAAAYIGKCIAVIGKVRDIRKDSPNNFFVILGDNEGALIAVRFTAESIGKVLHIPRDTMVKVHGRVYSVDKLGLTLQESELDR